MNNLEEKYLPVGTIVMLAGGAKKVMIIGFNSMSFNGNSKMYDYVGCVYPEGFSTNNHMMLFDHDQIAQIYHMGLVDEEEQKFKGALKTIVSNANIGANSVQKHGTAVQPVQPSAAQQQSVFPNEVSSSMSVSEIPKNAESSQSTGFAFAPDGTVISAPTTQQQPVSPVGPGLSENVAPTQSTGFTFAPDGTALSAPEPQLAQTASVPAQASTMQFDENGILISE